MTGLVAATQVDRHHRPDGRRSPRPRPAPTQANGAKVTVDRHRHRRRRRRVAGVEVSTDGGDTWHPATGHDLVDATPTSSTASAADADPGAGHRRQRQHRRRGHAAPSPSTCPCSVFGADGAGDAGRQRRRRRRARACGSRPTADGFVTGVRFYKGAGNTGTHDGLAVDRERPAAGAR